MIFGGIIAITGSVFLLLAALGIIRMPDVLNRMQAGTKATTLGSILFFLGTAIARPEWTGKAVLLITFIIFTNPVSSHALARASQFLKGAVKTHPECGNAFLEDENLGNEHLKGKQLKDGIMEEGKNQIVSDQGAVE